MIAGPWRSVAGAGFSRLLAVGQGALARDLQTGRVDIVLLTRAPIELAYASVAQGNMVYEQDPATRVENEAPILSLYADSPAPAARAAS